MFGLATSALVLAPEMGALDRIAGTKKENGGSFEPTIIEGIKVYGDKHPIQDVETFQTIMLREEEETLPGIGEAVKQLSRNELIERRKNLLPNSERYLDVVIPEKVFKRFSNINDGVKDFPTWYKKYQNARTNDLIKKGIPGLDLNIVIKRILVLADPLMENYSVQFDPTKDKWHHDNLGRLPLDIDLRRAYLLNYNDILNPNNTGPDGPIIDEKGYPIPLDDGVIHDDFHALFFMPDWYLSSLKVNNSEGYLTDIRAYQADIMGGRKANITPASALLIHSVVEKFKFRGVMVNDIPSADIIETPQRAVVTLKSSGRIYSQTRNNKGFVFDNLGYTLLSPDEKQRGEGWYEMTQLPKDQFKLNSTTAVIEKEALVTGFPHILADSWYYDSGNRHRLVLPIPRLLMRVATQCAAVNGTDFIPNFNIHINEQACQPGSKIVMETVWKNNTDIYKADHPELRVFATCDILSTGAVHVWSWQD